MGMMDADWRPNLCVIFPQFGRMGRMGSMFLVFLSMVCSMLHREDFRCSYTSEDPAHRARALPRPDPARLKQLMDCSRRQRRQNGAGSRLKVLLKQIRCVLS
jgi:hypothetical protein